MEGCVVRLSAYTFSLLLSTRPLLIVLSLNVLSLRRVLDRVDSIGLAVSGAVSVVVFLFFYATAPSSTRKRGSYLHRPSSLSSSSFPQRNILRYKKYASAYKWSLAQQPADVYVVRPLAIFLASLLCSYVIVFQLAAKLSLLVADGLQSIGSSMSAKWVHDGTVAAGRFCTAQGIIKQLGEYSVGLATMVVYNTKNFN